MIFEVFYENLFRKQLDSRKKNGPWTVLLKILFFQVVALDTVSVKS